MNRAEKFKEIFGIYAEEFWSKSEQEMLDWIDEEMEPISNKGWEKLEESHRLQESFVALFFYFWLGLGDFRVC